MAAGPSSMPAQQGQTQEEGAVGSKDKGRQEDEVAGGDQPKDSLERDGQQAIDDGECVVGQVDTDGVEEVGAVKGVLAELL